MDKKLLHSKDLFRFFVFTLLYSWLLWIPLAIAQVPVRTSPWFYLMALGGFSPSLMGIIFIIRTRLYTRDQVTRTFLSFRPIGVRNLLLSLLALIIPFTCSLAIDYLVFRTLPQTQNWSSMFASPVTGLLTIATYIYGGPINEEFGWRGFATRVLSEKYSVLFIGLLTGSIWSIWHYPLLFLNGQYSIDNYFVHISVHLLKHVALSIILVFFYFRTQGSVLLSMMLHMVSNFMFNVFYPLSFRSILINTLLLVGVALLCVVIDKKKRNKVETVMIE